MCQLSILDVCSPFIERTMMNTTMALRTNVKIRSGPGIHSEVVVLYVPSITRASHLVTFIDEACGHVRDFHMEWKGQASELLKRQICRVRGQYGCMIKRIVLDCGIERAKGSKDLAKNGIEVHLTSYYTAQKVETAEQISPLSQEWLWTLLIQTGAPGSSWT